MNELNGTYILQSFLGGPGPPPLLLTTMHSDLRFYGHRYYRLLPPLALSHTPKGHLHFFLFVPLSVSPAPYRLGLCLLSLRGYCIGLGIILQGGGTVYNDRMLSGARHNLIGQC